MSLFRPLNHLLTSTSLLFILFITACSKEEKQRESKPINVTVETAGFSGTGTPTVYVGQVEEQASTAASFTGMGTIEQVCVAQGEPVKKGQLLAVMNSETARSALAAAQAQLRQAQDAYSRLSQLHENGSLPEIKWIEVESKLEMAKSQLAMTEKQVNDSRLTSPANGIVGRNVKRSGETAMPAQPVMNILDIDRVKIKIAVPEKDYPLFAESDLDNYAIKVPACGDVRLNPVKMERGVQGNPTTHTYDIYLYVENPGHKLLPGMVAEVNFDSAQDHEVMMLPVRVVRKKGDNNYVWIVEDGKAHIQPVITGSIIGNNISIINGLVPGDSVITEGYQKLSEGSTINAL